MMTKKILIRFGDMMLKGKNIGFFIKKVRTHLIERLKPFDVSYELRHDRIFVGYNLKDEKALIEVISSISGIHSYSIVYMAEPNFESIILVGTHVLNEEAKEEMMRLKIETKRIDKSFPLTSIEVSRRVAGEILKHAQRKYIVDVKTPEEKLFIELREQAAYIYMKSYPGMGGFPYSTQGKGLLMMSGGIDSPIAGYLAMKQGIEVELIHFESTPLTPLESVQKVIDLSKKLAKFTPLGVIKLHVVPFTTMHKAILNHVFEPYSITVMRRMMYRIAERFTKKKKILCLINGESVGQVASQTLNSIAVVESVTSMPILRPLITYDKIDIIKLSQKIDTYDISIKPFNDCCSIYVPKNPVTKPMQVYADKYEQSFDYIGIIDETVKEIITMDIHENETIDITRYGFDVKSAYDTYLKEKSDKDDYIFKQ